MTRELSEAPTALLLDLRVYNVAPSTFAQRLWRRRDVPHIWILGSSISFHDSITKPVTILLLAGDI